VPKRPASKFPAKKRKPSISVRGGRVGGPLALRKDGVLSVERKERKGGKETSDGIERAAEGKKKGAIRPKVP